MSDTTQGGSGSPTRRHFLASAGAAAAGVAMLRDWRSTKAFAAANAAVAGANNRVKIGIIGVGNMGMGHLGAFVGDVGKNVGAQVVAICDIYEPRKAAAKAKVEGECKVYSDYRKLLDDKDIDAVLIATPEHWHYQMAADTLEAKKPVYLEKPLTLHLEDANKIYDLWKTKHSDVVFQLGNQNSSDPKWLYIHDKFVPEIGKVLWSQNSYTRNTPGGEWNTKIDADASPANLDWKAFLGPAPDRPFDKERFFRWRKFWDYSSGICGDLLAHRLYPFLIAIYGAKAPQLPISAVSAGGLYVETDREVPDVQHLMIDFADKHTIFLAGSTVNETGVEPMIRGTRGNISMVAEVGGDMELRPEKRYAEDLDPQKERAPQPPLGLHDMHRTNWVECIRSKKQTNCHMELAYAGMIGLAMGDLAYRNKAMMRFDPEKRQLLTKVDIL